MAAAVPCGMEVQVKGAVIGSEFRIDSEIVAGLTNKNSPVVASNGSGYLVAWKDGNGSDTAHHIYGALLSSDPLNHTSQPLDFGGDVIPGGIPGGTGGWDQMLASSSGRDYVLLWLKRDPNQCGLCSHFVGATVTSSGGVTKVPELPYETDWSRPMSLGFLSTNYFLAWDSSIGDYGVNVLFHLTGVAISSSGTALSPEPVQLTDFGISTQENPALASNGTNYLLAYRSAPSAQFLPYTVQGRRLDANGSPLETNQFQISPKYADQVVSASNGKDFLVAWVDVLHSSLSAALVTGGEAVTNQITLPSLPGVTSANMALTFDGQQYLLIFGTTTQAMSGIYILNRGNLLYPSAPFPLLQEKPVQQVAVASAGNGLSLVVGIDSGDPAGRVVGQFVSSQAPIVQSITRTGATVSLSWAGEIGRSYQVEYRNGLQDQSWSVLKPATSSTNQIGVVTDSISAATPLRLYRVSALP